MISAGGANGHGLLMGMDCRLYRRVCRPGDNFCPSKTALVATLFLNPAKRSCGRPISKIRRVRSTITTGILRSPRKSQRRMEVAVLSFNMLNG